jgi:hypothetical protein
VGLKDHPRVQALLALSLDPAGYVIAGSGPLLARGWIDVISDIDIVVRPEIFAKLARRATPELAPYPPTRRILLPHRDRHDVEILDGWFPARWRVDDLIAGADTVDGLRFVALDVVVATKRMLGRPRDVEHLKVLALHGYPRGERGSLRRRTAVAAPR